MLKLMVKIAWHHSVYFFKQVDLINNKKLISYSSFCHFREGELLCVVNSKFEQV